MKITKQNLMKGRFASVARVVACASFLVLTIIGVSSLVKAMSLEAIANENGIPSIWQAASLGNPETITIPITYWDQREDDCNDPDRQFEWSLCRLYAKGIIRDVVKSQLGSDGLPVPTYNNNVDAWNAYHDVFTANVIGNDPVLPTDNFYRWFHETYDETGKQLSKRYDREIVFHRSGNNSYEYGSKGTFPLDDVDFSNADSATATGHNFHFTAHMAIPMKISANGSEEFWFSGDDDVWVFLNGQLVLDLGGLHMDTEGSFHIDANGNVISTVNNVADAACRQEKVFNPQDIGYDTYNSQVENACPRSPVTTTFNTNFKSGDVVNLDFFYAERSTSESNTRINIYNMNWPISADSDIEAKVVGKIDDTSKNLVEFTTSITNRDPLQPLDLERLAAHITEKTDQGTTQGFLPLDETTLWYTTTPNDDSSWQPVKITAPSNTTDGFNLETPLRMSPAGTTGDTLYFRYYGETSENSGTMTSVISYYTSLNGNSGVTYDYDDVSYEGKPSEQPTPEHNVTIKYIYAEDKSPAADDFTGTFKKGQEFEIPSPGIDGYTPNIKVVTGEMGDEDLTYIVEYTITTTVTPDPAKHTVTIHYVYEDGTPAADTYVEEFEPGSEFEVLSPEIEGHTPDQDKISDTVTDSDLEYIVRYKKNDDVVPGPTDPDPTDPDTPDTPDLPNIPTIPGSNIIDGDIPYLPPLGEISFVPNTGIISDAVAAVFSDSFASVVLSQGFVMVMLLIFSGSFATYFSFRKYMDLEMAAATTKAKSRKAMSKKTVTKNQKITRKK